MPKQPNGEMQSVTQIYIFCLPSHRKYKGGGGKTVARTHACTNARTHARTAATLIFGFALECHLGVIFVFCFVHVFCFVSIWHSRRFDMECATGTGTAHSRPSSSRWTQAGRRAARKAPARFLPFVLAASSVNKQNSTLASDLSRRQTLQQLMLAAAALSLNVTSHVVHPHRAEAALVQFPAADLRNSYYLVSLTRKAVAVHCCKGDNLQV